MAVLGDQHGVFPLCGQATVFGDRRPAVRQYLNVPLALVEHGFYRDYHPRLQDFTFTGLAVMQDMRVFVEVLANTMPTKFSDDRISIAFRKSLDCVADVAQSRPMPDLLNAEVHGFLGDFDESFGMGADLADAKHLAGVAMITVLDDGNINVDNIPGLKFFVAGNAVANRMVDRGADRLWKAR